MGDAGRSEKMSDKDVLRLVALSPDPFVTASELVEDSEYESRQGMSNRLNKLSEKGLLASRQVGSRSKVYWLTREGRRKVSEIR